MEDERSLLRGVQRLAQYRIIRVALGAAAVEGRLVRRIERGAALEALDQIGIGEERFSECDQVGLISREHFGREFEIIAVVGDVSLLETLAQAAVVERRDVAWAAGRAFDDMNVSQLQRVEMVDDMIE